MKRSTLILIVALTSQIAPAVNGQTVTTLTGDFSASGGVKVAADGNIFVADFGTDFSATGTHLFKITPDGNVATFSTNLLGATGGVFDADGNLFWSSFGGNRVDKIETNGAVSRLAAIAGPVAMVADSAGDIYVASCSNNNIVRITPEGATSVFASSSLFNCANGMTMDEDHNLYVSNFNDGRVMKITPAGVVSLFKNLPGNNSVNLAYAAGYIYVTIRAAHKIHRISMDGQDEVFAGTGARGRADGPALQATFSLPNGIGVSPDGGKIYVNDVFPLSGNSFHPSLLRVIDIDAATSVQVPAERPKSFQLAQNYPNPFNPTTTIRYRIQRQSKVRLSVYNTLGERVRLLVDEKQSPGEKAVVWDGRNDSGRPVSSGLYLYEIELSGQRESRKMLFLK